jgi:acetyl-CoA carboxylase carboxyl transferase subunit alpha
MTAALDFERPLVELEHRIDELKRLSPEDHDLAKEVSELEARAAKLLDKTYRNLSPWQVVQLSRHPDRPYTLDYVRHIVDDFVELHGDRHFGEDPAIVAGFGRIAGRACLIVGHQKGRATRENLRRNFGMPRPEGYRKAQRLFQLAERFGRPIVTLIDTPGAYPGLGAEERGQAEAIATNLVQMASLRVPVVACIVGEGGSGGALALGVANRVVMLQYGIYSVISPEGCASILFRDAGRAKEAAAALHLTAPHLLAMDVLDEAIPEPAGGAHRNPAATAKLLSATIGRHLDELSELQGDALVADRHDRFRHLGLLHEGLPEGLVGDELKEAKSAESRERKAAKEAGRRRERRTKAAEEALARGEAVTLASLPD